MHHRHFTTFALLALSSTAMQAETPAPAVDLFSGNDLSAWEFVTATPTELTKVCSAGGDGIVSVIGKPVGYLATKAPHENYLLHYEWRWPAGAKNSNGGVLIHIASGPSGGTAWPVCFQAQLKMDHAGDLLPMGTAHFAETLSSPMGAKTPQLDKKEASNEKPPGEWNVGDITCKADSIEVTINGVLQNHVSMAAPAVGKIGFQLEGAPFDLRNVRLSPLPTSK